MNCAIPTAPHRNNPSLFKLARAFLCLPPLTPKQKLQTFARWYAATEKLGFLREVTSREEYQLDFMRALKHAELPLGASVVDQDWQKVLAEPRPPDWAELFPRGQLALLRLCYELSKIPSSADWFLSCRDAAKCIGTSHVTASRILDGFVAAGILSIAGESTQNSARRYRWNGLE